MSRLDDLIQKCCPNGVEYKAISDITTYEQPTPYIVKSTKYDDSYSTPVLTAGQSFVLGYTDETDGIYKATKVDPVIIFDDFTGAFKWVDFDFKVKSSAMKIIKTDESVAMIRYLYHIMGNIGFNSDEHKRLWISTYSAFQIPLPPLEVQGEIVRILDNFTELTKELTKELTARQKQYEYYRNLLLTFDNAASIISDRQVQWLKIKDVCVKVTSGGTPTATNQSYYNGGIPWLRTQEIDWTDIYDTAIKISQKGLDNSSAKWIPENCVIVAMYGATAAKVAINKIPLTTNQACCNLQIDEKIALYRYVFHWLCHEYQNLKSLGRGSQSNIDADIVKNYSIPVPSLNEQKRIVDILDKFDVICTDLISGLPAEIEARTKQYEYYRDKLLTFKEKVA